jgi:hypothetical protein
MINELEFSGVTPVGRIISEQIWEPTTKGYQGKQLDSPVWYIQIAIAKTDPRLPEFFGNITGAANSGFFNGEQNRPDFAWKFKDGDAPENVNREAWPGCYVFTFRTGFAPNAIVDINSNPIIDRNQVKPGYQVRVAYNVKPNGNNEKPGIYLNFNMVQLISIDKEIQSGPPPAQVFAQAAQALPLQPGAVPANVPQPGPQVAPAPQYQQSPPMEQGPGPNPQYAPAPQVQPDPGFLQPGPTYQQPEPAPQPGQPGAPVGFGPPVRQ